MGLRGGKIISHASSIAWPRSPSQAGLTLLEIVLILVIFSLLVGGILQGQQLITNARVRSVISQQDKFKIAYLGFRDRYRAFPGDYATATANIGGVTVNGNGNGLITPLGVSGATIDENIAVWEHLSKSNFVPEGYVYAAAPETIASAPINVYSRYLQFIYDNVYGTGTPTPRHNLKTGNFIPSSIMSEVDTKIDDGIATTGAFQFSSWGGVDGSSPTGAGACFPTTGTPFWNASDPVANCGAATMM